MDNKNDFSHGMKFVVEATQVGVSIIMPMILFAVLGTYLKKRFGIGDVWVIALIVFGLFVGIGSFISFVKRYLKDIDNESHKE